MKYDEGDIVSFRTHSNAIVPNSITSYGDFQYGKIVSNKTYNSFDYLVVVPANTIQVDDALDIDFNLCTQYPKLSSEDQTSKCIYLNSDEIYHKPIQRNKGDYVNIHFARVNDRLMKYRNVLQKFYDLPTSARETIEKLQIVGMLNADHDFRTWYILLLEEENDIYEGFIVDSHLIEQYGLDEKHNNKHVLFVCDEYFINNDSREAKLVYPHGMQCRICDELNSWVTIGNINNDCYVCYRCRTHPIDALQIEAMLTTTS